METQLDFDGNPIHLLDQVQLLEVKNPDGSIPEGIVTFIHPEGQIEVEQTLGGICFFLHAKELKVLTSLLGELHKLTEDKELLAILETGVARFSEKISLRKTKQSRPQVDLPDGEDLL